MACDLKYNTGNPLCSDSLQDLRDNAVLMDQYINSSEFEVTDRLGNKRLTWSGIKPSLEQKIDDMVIAAGGVEIAQEFGDSPDKVVSQKKVTEEFGHLRGYVENIKDETSEGFKNLAERDIIFAKSPNIEYVQGDVNYTVIRNIDFNTLQLKSNATDDPSVMTRMTARQARNKYGAAIVSSSIAFKNADNSSGSNNDTLRPNGIYIENNILISDWGSSTSTARNQACCLMSNGNMKRYYRENSTGGDMVDEGAQYGFSWGAFCVYDNEIPEDLSTSAFADGTVSARTLILQMPDGSYSFVHIEGITYQSGADGFKCAEIAMSLGAKHAFILDGGGSTQCYWDNTYSVPSSDAITRSLPAFFLVYASQVEQFKTGIIPIADNTMGAPVDSRFPAIYLEQKSDIVSVHFNSSKFIQGLITRVPARFNPRTGLDIRSVLTSGGNIYSVTGGTGGGVGNITTTSIGSLTPPSNTLGYINYTVENE